MVFLCRRSGNWRMSEKERTDLLNLRTDSLTRVFFSGTSRSGSVALVAQVCRVKLTRLCDALTKVKAQVTDRLVLGRLWSDWTREKSSASKRSKETFLR